jgi:hypothetical protein
MRNKQYSENQLTAKTNVFLLPLLYLFNFLTIQIVPNYPSFPISVRPTHSLCCNRLTCSYWCRKIYKKLKKLLLLKYNILHKCMSLETMYHDVVSNWLITVRQVSKGLVLISICPFEAQFYYFKHVIRIGWIL